MLRGCIASLAGLVVCVTLLVTWAQQRDPPVSALLSSHAPSGDIVTLRAERSSSTGGHAPLPVTAADDVEASDELDADEAIAILSGVVPDGDGEARLEAVITLAEVGSGQAVTTLTATALSDADSSIREQAVYALGDIGGDTAIQALQQASNDHHAAVRDAAAEQLGELHLRRETEEE